MKIIKIILLIILGIAVFITLFINLNPQFGANPSYFQKKLYSTFPNYVDGEFKNHEPTKLFTEDMDMGNFFKDHPNLIPKKDITPNNLDLEFFWSKEDDDIKLSWLGHSAFVINVSGIIIMLDPMLGQYAAPLPMPSLKRYSKEIAFEIDEIDTIDVVVYSHDHYDHLD